MTQTTTYQNACDVSVWLDNAAGTLTDISGSSNTMNPEFTQMLGELSTFQQKWPVRTGCRKDGTFTLTAVYSTATNEATDILHNWFFAASPGARTLTFYIPSKNVGSDKFSGEVVLENYSWVTAADEPSPIAITAVLRPTGEFTYAANAT